MTDDAGKLVERLKQILTVCEDNASDTCDHRMALDFVRQIATADHIGDANEMVPTGVDSRKVPSEEEIARGLAYRHYRRRFENSTPEHIQMNVDANWGIFLEQVRDVLSLLKGEGK